MNSKLYVIFIISIFSLIGVGEVYGIDTFDNSLEGWNLENSSDYSLTISDGMAMISGDDFSKQITASKTFPVKATLISISFDWMAKSGCSCSSTTNFKLDIYDSSDNLLHSESLVSGGTLDTGKQFYSKEISGYDDTGANSIIVKFSLSDSWSTNWEQSIWFDNVEVIVLEEAEETEEEIEEAIEEEILSLINSNELIIVAVTDLGVTFEIENTDIEITNSPPTEYYDGMDYDEFVLFAFGDGSDGDVVFSEDGIITTDKNYRNLTIHEGVTVTVPHGLLIKVSEELILHGTIQVETVSGNPEINGAELSGYVVNGGNGEDGENGQTAHNVSKPKGGKAGTAGLSGDKILNGFAISVEKSLTADIGRGGQGGTSGAGGTSGCGGSRYSPPCGYDGSQNGEGGNAITGSPGVIGGLAGGGIQINARIVSGTGSINVDGENGHNGIDGNPGQQGESGSFHAGGSSGAGAPSGGSGAGSGGYVLLVYEKISAITIDSNGGIGGNPGLGSVGGAARKGGTAGNGPWQGAAGGSSGGSGSGGTGGVFGGSANAGTSGNDGNDGDDGIRYWGGKGGDSTDAGKGSNGSGGIIITINTLNSGIDNSIKNVNGGYNGITFSLNLDDLNDNSQ